MTESEYSQYEQDLRRSLKAGDFVRVKYNDKTACALVLVTGLSKDAYDGVFYILVCQNRNVHWLDRQLDTLGFVARFEDYRYEKLV